MQFNITRFSAKGLGVLLISGWLCAGFTSAAQSIRYDGAAPEGSHCDPPTMPFSAEFVITNSPLPGETADFLLTITPTRDLDRVALAFSSEGIVMPASPLDQFLTGLETGVPVEVSGSINLAGPGSGALLLSTTWFTTNACGDVEQETEEFGLYVLDDGVSLRFGGSSVIALRFQRVQDLLDSSALSMEEALAAADALRGTSVMEIAPPPSTTGGSVSGGTGNVQIGGTISWTDMAGGLHPMRFIEVKAYRPGLLFGINEVATTTTNAAGQFSFNLTSGSLGGSPRDITLRFFAENFATDVKSPASFIVFGGDTYYGQIVFDDVADGANMTGMTLSVGNADTPSMAFSIADAMIVGSQYQSSVEGSAPARIDSNFPRSDSGTASFYNGSSITIHNSKPYAWDVLLHEYGHYIADIFTLDDSPGGSHNCSEDLIASKGKSPGSRLAWGEGLATYLAIAAQIVTNTSALGVPQAGDTSYHSVSATTGNMWQYDNETRDSCNAIGEGAETNVSRCLLDVADSAADGDDQIALGHASVWSMLRGASSPDSLSDAWNAFVAGQSVAQTILFGEVFEQNTVSPAQTAPADGTAVAMMPPTFRWSKNTLNEFTVRFYDESFNEIGASMMLGDVTSWTPMQAEWDTIRGAADTILWVVEGENTAAPSTGTYWSGSRKLGGVDFAFVIDDTGSMSEEIGGVRAALITFLGMFDAASTDISFQLTTFKDNVSVRPPTKDLATIQAQVSGLGAFGGSDCPENSAGALAQGTIAMKRGGTVLLATDADPRPGSDLTALINQLRAQGARVNVLLSGTCSGFLLPDASQTGLVSLNGDFTSRDITAGLPGSLTKPTRSLRSFTGSDPRSPMGGVSGGGSPNAIDFYSQIATATGGTFAFIPEVNTTSNGVEEYRNTAENILQASVGPRVVLVTPSALPQGATATLTVKGQNTNFLSTSLVSFAGGVTVLGTTALDPTTLIVDVQVGATTMPGFRSIAVSTDLGGGVVELAEGMGVLLAQTASGVPELVSANPSAAELGETVDVTIRGLSTAFDPSTMLNFGSGIVVNSVSVTSATSAVANVSVEPSASIGFRTVTALTGTEFAQSSALDFFRVQAQAPSIPLITSVFPIDGNAGEAIELILDVNLLELDAEGTTVEFSGSGISVSSIVACDNRVVAMIVIAPDAAPGARDVIVRSGGRSAFANDAFSVTGEGSGFPSCPPLPPLELGPVYTPAPGVVLFSDLDGGPDDLDGFVNNAFSREDIVLSTGNTIYVDVPVASFNCKSLVMNGSATIRNFPGVPTPATGPTLFLNVRGRMTVSDHANIESHGSTRGGLIAICLENDSLVMDDYSWISARGTGISAPTTGGEIQVTSGSQIIMNSNSCLMTVDSDHAGDIRLQACRPCARALDLSGRLQASSYELWNGRGGQITLQAVSGGAWVSHPQAIRAYALFHPGSIDITVAGRVTPQPAPLTVPPAHVMENTSSTLTCQCLD